MRKNLVLFLSFLALMATPYSRAQEDDFDFDDSEMSQEDVDFSDESVSDADFAEDSSSDSTSDTSTAEADPNNVVEPIAPDESEQEIPVAEDTAPEAPSAPIVDTDTPPSIASGTLADGVAFGDEPDLEYEARLYDIYVNYNSKPTSDGEWNKLLAERTVENYRIQKGDTLWDISATIFGDGNYWPKIWSINSGITNPHLIEPQNVIKFILGDESGPPAFTVTEADSSSAAPSAGGMVEPEPDVVGTPEPEIPPPTIRSRPVVRRLPPSLPQWQDPQSVNSNFDNVGIEYKRRKIADVIDSIPLSSYISETPPEALGEVQEIETGNQLASSLQYIYVTVKGEAEIGDQFLAVSNRGRVMKTTPLIKDDFLGYGIEVLGEIQLVEKVNGENERERGALYRALVTKIVNPVQVGSTLVKGKIESINLAETGARSQLVAQIIGGQLFNQRQVYGPESIAYLNKGSDAGLEVGQMLPIRANRKLRNEKSMVTGNVRAIGWLKIVKTTPRFATAIVLRAWSDILTGDLTGAGEMSAISLDSSLDEPVQTSLLKELDDDNQLAPQSTTEDEAEEDIGGEADFSEDENFDDDDF